MQGIGLDAAAASTAVAGAIAAVAATVGGCSSSEVPSAAGTSDVTAVALAAAVPDVPAVAAVTAAAAAADAVAAAAGGWPCIGTAHVAGAVAVGDAGKPSGRVAPNRAEDRVALRGRSLQPSSTRSGLPGSCCGEG